MFLPSTKYLYNLTPSCHTFLNSIVQGGVTESHNPTISEYIDATVDE